MGVLISSSKKDQEIESLLQISKLNLYEECDQLIYDFNVKLIALVDFLRSAYSHDPIWFDYYYGVQFKEAEQLKEEILKRINELEKEKKEGIRFIFSLIGSIFKIPGT